MPLSCYSLFGAKIRTSTVVRVINCTCQVSIEVQNSSIRSVTAKDVIVVGPCVIGIHNLFDLLCLLTTMSQPSIINVHTPLSSFAIVHSGNSLPDSPHPMLNLSQSPKIPWPTYSIPLRRNSAQKHTEAESAQDGSNTTGQIHTGT